MSKLTVTLSTEQADYIRSTVAPAATVDYWDGALTGEQRIALGDAACAYLEQLPEDADGHLDSEGRLWIGGVGYPLDVIHNA